MKTITIVLEDLRSNALHGPENSFRVKKATNTIEYPIGEYVSKSLANELCNKPGYTVNIVQKS